MGLLPAIGQITYGAVTFGPETETIGFSVRPIESSDGRTSIANKYTLRIRTIVAEGTAHLFVAETDMPIIREELTKYGQRLIINGKGIGDIDVNAPDFLYGDLMWGPKPTELSWKPCGQTSAELIWQVEFVLTDCSSRNPYARVMEHSWEADFTIDRNRLTRRDIRGMIRVAGRVTNGVGAMGSADPFYDKYVPPIPFGYRRENEQRGFDRSKSVLNFSFSDVMMEMPLPRGCLDADIEINHNNDSMIWSKWNMSISATYHMAQDAPMSWSFEHYANLLRDRIAAVRLGMIGGGGVIPNGGGGGVVGGGVFQGALWDLENRRVRAATMGLYGAIRTEHVKNQVGLAGKELATKAIAGQIMPLTFNIVERPQTRTMSYSASFMCMWPIDVLMLHGMWRPIPGHDHNVWRQSMAVANKPRGYSQEVQHDGFDVIVNLCDTDRAPKMPLNLGPIQPLTKSPAAMLNIGCPDWWNSWIVYYNFVTIKQNNKVISHQPLPQKVKKPKVTGTTSLGEDIAAMFEDGWKPNKDDAPMKDERPIIQKVGPTNIEVIIEGRALRVCYGIPQPQIVSVGGVEAIEANRWWGPEFFTQGVVGTSGGLPIYGAKWRLRWVLKDYPKTGVQPGGNPVFAVQEGGNGAAGGALGNPR